MKLNLKRLLPVIVALISAIVGAFLWQKYQAYNFQNMMAQRQPSPYVSYEIDPDKIKTLEDAIALIKIQLPEKPVLNIKPDSLKDSEKLESIRHLLINPPLTPAPMRNIKARK